MNPVVIVAVILVLLLAVGVLVAQGKKRPSPSQASAPALALPNPPSSGCPLALPTSAGGKPLPNKKGCHHDLCCDSLCPSLSQYYNPLTKSCMERPMMPYGYGLAGGPCVEAFQWCSANPPQPKASFPEGLPSEEASPCPTLCDRFGGSLYYTGFGGVAAQRPPFFPSTYDGFQSFMGAKYASDNYVSSASGPHV